MLKTKICKATLAIAPLLCCSSYAATIGNTDIGMSGYIKADGMWSQYSDGTLSSGNVGRDFYIPGLTPVGGNDESTQFDAHIRQSRFRFTSKTAVDENNSVTGVFEFDFQTTVDGNERVSNSYTPRIRHAFISYKNWLVGQTWSTFMDVSTLPESLDFVGTTDAAIFARQTQVRYTNGSWEFALENPESTITPYGGGGRIVADDNAMPDAVVRYSMKQDWGHISVAGLVRQLSYDDGVSIDDSETSYGISLNGVFKFGKDDLRVAANYGSGLGRYIGLNVVNGGVLNANGDIEAIDSYGVSIAYRHLWDDQLRSNIMYSMFSADNDTVLTGLSATKETYSVRANILYNPIKPITVGAELAYAKRELESGADGDMTRLQFSAKYAF